MSASPCGEAPVKREIHLEKILCMSNAAVGQTQRGTRSM
jgi:hypothetical protein